MTVFYLILIRLLWLLISTPSTGICQSLLTSIGILPGKTVLFGHPKMISIKQTPIIGPSALAYKFLLSPKTVSQDTCPESYLQLLSLRNDLDGFLILKNFIFLRSPQLDGKYRDFHSNINSLNIHPGEHICTFYGRAIWLGNEISLANMADGTLAVLHECFIALLRDTQCSIIIGETSTYWRQIWDHHLDPTKLLVQLPWSSNDVLHSLETAGIETLSNNNNTNNNSISPPLIPRFAASSTMDPSLHSMSVHPSPMAYASHSTHNKNNNNSPYTHVPLFIHLLIFVQCIIITLIIILMLHLHPYL